MLKLIKNILFVLIGLFGYASLPALAQDATFSLNRCDARPEKTKITVKSNQQGIVTNNNVRSKRLSFKINNSLAGDFIIGLTSLESKTTIDFSGNTWNDKTTGGECLAANISVDLEYEPIEIFIASEFRPGSCSYNAILAHEMEHVNLYLENLPKLKNTIQNLMDQRFASKPIFTEKGQSYRFLRKEIDTLWRPLIKSEFSKIQIEQNILDDRDHISQLNSSCMGEIERTLGSFLF